MPCDECKKQEEIARYHWHNASYLRNNGPFDSKRKTKQMIEEAEKLAANAQKIVSGHLANCPECQKKPIPSLG
jgi:hypothetical protein